MNNWLYRPHNAAATTPRMRLFCFPYAGGWPSVYRSWSSRLPQDVELIAIRMPGRESRFAETSYNDWTALTKDAVEALRPLLDVPFVLFGHSFGGMLAYEVARALSCENVDTLKALIVSGCRSPLVLPHSRAPFDGTSDALWTWLAQLEGTPDEILESPQLRALMEPPLRADLELANAWTGAPDVVDLPIVTFGGTDDRIVPRGQIEPWRDFTARTYRHVEFSGGHFFIHSLEAEVVAEIGALCQAA